jgi:glycosyltransferase involved in cell wall biosynthesis
VYGSGWDAEALRQRAGSANLPVKFAGFSTQIASELAASDLLLHLCPTEPFGLAILEAMAARVPVLAPDAGGAGSLVTDEISGFHFQANDPDHLANRLQYVSGLAVSRLNQVICESQRSLRNRFSEQVGIGEYRRLILEGMS